MSVLKLQKIVSGGQTGVDRAALDAALELGIEAGGWCPGDRRAEDGIISSRYPLQPLPGAGYRERTRRNVTDSDGTLIIYFHRPSGGTKQTIDDCMAYDKPHLCVDAASTPPAEAAERVGQFAERHAIAILNVAGPRASGEPRAYAYAREVIRRLLRDRGA